MNEVHADGAAALGDDGNRPDGLDVVEASRGNKVCLDTLDELMRTGNDKRLQERGEDKGTKDAHPVVQDIDYAGEDIADQVAERAEHGEQGDVSKNQGNGRDKDERNDLGDVLLGNLFDLGHKPGSQDCREYAALESNHGNGERTKVPVLSTRRVHNERVAVHKARVNHDDTDEDAQDRVTAKTLDCAVHNQDRQVVERGGDNGKEACEVLEELAVIGEAAFHAKEAVGNDQRLKADDDSSADESGNDGDKDVREYLEDREELALLVRLGALDLGSADLLNARQSHKLIVNLVDGTGTEDDHELAAVVQHALDAIDVLELGLVVFARILEHQTQTGHAMRGALDVLQSADVVDDLLGHCLVVHVPLHSFSKS